ncbi:MAG: hypothetical protein CBC13_08680 [Planctomycetia bacterium TMED53]|nr:MAG: hypothetical protein CBC13_08680 [Planctomycetia bacterium TMED53]
MTRVHFDCCRLTFALAAPERLSPRESLKRALATSPTDSVIETILQSIPYSGFPGAVEAFGWLRSEVPEEASESRPSNDRDVFQEVYGGATDKVLGELSRRHMDLEMWIREFAYRSVMGTSPWQTVDLEFLAVSSLLAQARMTPFHSHLRGALRCGATAEELSSLLDDLQDVAQPQALATARDLLVTESRGD